MHDGQGSWGDDVCGARLQVGHGAGICSTCVLSVGGTLLASWAQSGQRTGWCGLGLWCGGQGQMVAALVYAVWYWEGRGCGCVRISCVVGMFWVRARNRKAVTVGGEALVRGEGVVVTSWVELCML